MHYTHVRPPEDMSGVRLRLTDAPLPFSAGMMMYASYFQIPPRAPSHLIPVRCCYSGFEPARGFAYRVHTHELGRCAAALPCPLPKCFAMGSNPMDCSDSSPACSCRNGACELCSYRGLPCYAAVPLLYCYRMTKCSAS